MSTTAQWQAAAQACARFEDSAEATAFISQIQIMLEDPRLTQWARATDSNFCAQTFNNLAEARAQFVEFVFQLENAE